MAATLLLLALLRPVLAGIQTEAVCLPAFSWMNNQRGQSPCLVSAYLLAQCGPDNSWDVPAIDLSKSPPLVYAAPSPNNSNILNVCGCSWAVYNLMEACIACQSDTEHSRSWSSWQASCTPDLLSDSFYPGEPYKINTATAVPFWATTNPVNWLNNVFNPTQARNIFMENSADVTTVSPPGKHKSVSAGAIAGGVVAAVVVVVLIALSVLFVLLRRKRNKGRTAPQLMSNGPKLSHMASSAGFSTRSRPFSPVFSDVVSPVTVVEPGPLPFAVPPSSEGGWSAAAPSSIGMYTPDPLILQPVAQYPTHAHSNSDSSMSSGTIVPMQVERASKEASQVGHSPQSSMSVVPSLPATQRGPVRYNPPPYSPTAATASSGLLPPRSGLPGALREDSRDSEELQNVAVGLQLVTPHDHHAESGYPPEKGRRI